MTELSGQATMLFRRALAVLMIWTLSWTLVTGGECKTFIEQKTGPFEVGDVVHSFNISYAGVLSFNAGCQYFRIVNGTEVVLKKDLDCTDSVHCLMDCNSTTHGIIGQEFFIQFTYLDITPPYFKSDNYNITVSENTPVGSLIYSFAGTVEDTDCGQKSFWFEMQGGQPFFSMTTSAGIVRLQKLLDFEIDRQYTLNITVKNKEKTANTELLVYVEDVDDMDPAFFHNMYTLNITEMSTPDIWLDADPPVRCYDRDEGINATMLYSFLDDSDRDGFFNINTVNGSLLTTEELDREEQSTYILHIKCYQEDNHFRSATATVTVTVADVNDNVPVFDPAVYNVSVVENTPLSYIVQVSATDLDEGEYAVFHYKVTDHEDVFDVGDTGVVSLKEGVTLDREDKSALELTILAVDNFGNYSSNNATVKLSVIDVNDNTPVFNDTQEHEISFDTADIGAVIFVILAHDADEPGSPNSEVTFEIQTPWTDCDSDAASLDFPLSLNASTGEIRIVKSVLPLTGYNMIIQACDNPLNENERRCVSTVFKATYMSISNVSTVSIDFEVVENVPRGSVVDRMPVTGNEYVLDTGHFEVDNNTHMLLTKEDIDRENKSSYSFHVQVKASSVLVGNISVKVTVLDANDNPPVFYANRYDFAFPDGTSHKIGTINSTDYDLDDNGNKIYSFHQLSEGLVGIVSIDPVTGEVSVTDGWKSLKQTIYRLTAVATDQGTPALRSMVPVTVSHVKAEENFKIRISSPIDAESLTKHKASLERELGDILNYVIKIDEIVPATNDVPSVRSYIFFSATYGKSTAVPGSELQRRVLDRWEEVQALFRQTSALSHNPSELQWAEIALIAIAGVILVGGIIAIAVIFKHWGRNEKHSRLFEHMSRRTIYDSQEMRMDFDEDIPSRNNTIRPVHSKRINTEEEEEGSFGFHNPAFRRDDDSLSTPRIPRWSTSDSIKDAMKSLEDLTDRLNAEDNLTRVSSMSRTRTAAPTPDSLTTPVSQLNNGHFHPTPDYPATDTDDTADEDDKIPVFMEKGSFPDSMQLKRVIEINSPNHDITSVIRSSLDVEEKSTAF